MILIQLMIILAALEWTAHLLGK